MFKKKHPILTANFCRQMEWLRQALEVLTGATVRFVCIDFNTRRFRVMIGFVEEELYFDQYNPDAFQIRYRNSWYIARLEDGEVRVIEELYKGEKMPMWWVGTSASNRRQEPLYR